jgi:hypothetical protein
MIGTAVGGLKYGGEYGGGADVYCGVGGTSYLISYLTSACCGAAAFSPVAE